MAHDAVIDKDRPRSSEYAWEQAYQAQDPLLTSSLKCVEAANATRDARLQLLEMAHDGLI